MSLRLVLALGLTFVLACGGDDDDDDDDVTVDAGNPDDPDAFVPPSDSYTVDWGPLTIQPGEEDTQCVVKRLGNPAGFRAHQIHNYLGDVSHHFIVYKTNDTDEVLDPFPCDPFTDTINPDAGAPLMITQKFEETLTLPDGVAFELAENQMIRLELHYINTGDSPKEVHPTSTFIPIAEGEFTDAADFLFAGDVNVDISAMSAGETTGYIPVPPELNGAKYFAVTGHEHQWGTNVTVATAMSAGNTVEMVYDVENFNWDEPDTVFHDPPFTVPDNGGFQIHCEWFNGSSSDVGFGESANQEMCFFWTYYYPSAGAKVCATHSGFGVSDCCPGGEFCGVLF